MKSYIEMSENVLRRRDEEIRIKNSRTQLIKNITAPAASICFIAVVGIAAWNISGNKKDIVVNSNIVQQTGITETSTTDNVSSVEDKTENILPDTEITAPTDIININSVDNIEEKSDMMLYALWWNDFIRMSEQELCEYYGTNVFPNVPEDLQIWRNNNGEHAYGIYRRENGTGEIYHDQNAINYSNDDFSRNVSISVAKGKIPYSFYAFWENDNLKPSAICGEEVYFAQSLSSGYYYVEFMHENIGFRMIIEGLSEDEILSIVRSLIE